MPIIPVEKISLDVPTYDTKAAQQGVLSNAIANTGTQVAGNIANVLTSIKKEESDATVTLQTTQDKISADAYYKKIAYDSPNGNYHEEVKNEVGETVGYRDTGVSLSEHFKTWSDDQFRAGQDLMPNAYAQENYRREMTPIYTSAIGEVTSAEYARREKNALLLQSEAVELNKKWVFENPVKANVWEALQSTEMAIAGSQLPAIDKQRVLTEAKSEIAREHYDGILYKAAREGNPQAIELTRKELLGQYTAQGDKIRQSNGLPTAYKSLSSKDQQELLAKIDAFQKQAADKQNKNARSLVDTYIDNVRAGGRAGEAGLPTFWNALNLAYSKPEEQGEKAQKIAELAKAMGTSDLVNSEILFASPTLRPEILKAKEIQTALFFQKASGILGINLQGMQDQATASRRSKYEQMVAEFNADSMETLSKYNTGKGDSNTVSQLYNNIFVGRGMDAINKNPNEFNSMLQIVRDARKTSGLPEEDFPISKRLAREYATELKNASPTDFVNKFQAIQNSGLNSSHFLDKLVENGLPDEYAAISAINTRSPHMLLSFVESVKIPPKDRQVFGSPQEKEKLFDRYYTAVDQVVSKYQTALISSNRYSTVPVKALQSAKKVAVSMAYTMGELDGASDSDIQKSVEARFNEWFGKVHKVKGREVIFPSDVSTSSVDRIKANIERVFYSNDGLNKLNLTAHKGYSQNVNMTSKINTQILMPGMRLSIDKNKAGQWGVFAIVPMNIPGQAAPAGQATLLTQETSEGPKPVFIPLSDLDVEPVLPSTQGVKQPGFGLGYGGF